MSYCLNPSCPQPQNLPQVNFCETCGRKICLRERYRAIKPIGRGGFGRTFLAIDEDKPSKPPCVIKQFFPAHQSNTQKAEELFYQEAVRLDQLGKHPQIPDLYAYFIQDSHQYLVLEFIDGPNLEQELAHSGSFNETKIRNFLLDLLPVLQFVHDHQVIHRDIKPENIIRRQNIPPSSQFIPANQAIVQGQLVLVDFGAAKVLTGGDSLKTGTIIGSPEYVAPEQIRGKAIFGSDIYSLGATCLHLLTSMSPFDLFDVYENTWNWRDFLTTNPVSKKLGQIIDKMLIVNPLQRYQSAQEILQDLGETTARPLVVSSTTPAPPPTPAPRRAPTPPPSQPSGRTTPGPSAGPKVPPTTKPESKPKRPVASRSVPTWQCVYTLKGHENGIMSVAFSPDGEILASGSQDRTIEIWRLNQGKRWFTLTGHQDWVTCVAFSPDGKALASGSRDKTIEIWRMDQGKRWFTLKDHTDGVEAIAFTPDSQLLVSGSRDNHINIWNLQKARKLLAITSTDKVYAVAVHPQGHLIASGGKDAQVKLCKISDGQLLTTLTGHQDWVKAIAFSASNLLASGSRDGTIKLWQIDDQGNSLLKRTLIVEGEVSSLTFSPDSQLLVSGNSDKTMQIWELNTGSLLEVLTGHSGDVLSVAFSGNGKMLASGSSDKTVKIWQQ